MEVDIQELLADTMDFGAHHDENPQSPEVELTETQKDARARREGHAKLASPFCKCFLVGLASVDLGN